MEQVAGIEPASSAWKADILAVIRYLHCAEPRPTERRGHYLIYICLRGFTSLPLGRTGGIRTRTGRILSPLPPTGWATVPQYKTQVFFEGIEPS